MNQVARIALASPVSLSVSCSPGFLSAAWSRFKEREREREQPSDDLTGELVGRPLRLYTSIESTGRQPDDEARTRAPKLRHSPPARHMRIQCSRVCDVGAREAKYFGGNRRAGVWRMQNMLCTLHLLCLIKKPSCISFLPRESLASDTATRCSQLVASSRESCSLVQVDSCAIVAS